MSFPRYPKYKDSGVEWLGQVPEHWEAIRYKNVFEEKFVKAGGSLPLGSISFGRVVFKSDDFFNEATKATYQEVLAGEFLINPINLNYDLKSLRTAFSEINTCVSPAYIVLKAKGAPDKNYLKHQLHAFDLFHMKTLGAGVRQTITFEDIGTCQTYLPPLPEQTRIAAFLDQETAKIDALVTEQQRLMELLKEKRQAVIAHAVTKGLNPEAALKPSGIEWLGDVPAHWEVTRIKRLSSLISKGTTPMTVGADFTTDGIRFLKAENITEAGVAEQPEFFISEEAHATLSRSSLADGDVLVVIAGATTGKSCVLSKEILPANTNQAVSFIRPKNKTHSAYINSWIGTSLVRNFIFLNSVQSAQPNLSMEDLGNIPLLVPPPNELKEIQNFLTIETARFDTLTAEAQRAIDLLQERRTAVISAAVTGQIDVRHN